MHPDAPTIPTTDPARVYYEACVGKWRAPVSITVTDPAALLGSGLSRLDRLSVRLLSVWPSWLGRIYLDTTVSLSGDSEVVHTTVVRWMGLPLQTSVETFTLDPDGHRFTVSGGMTGFGAIDPTATEGDYTLTWLGMKMRQRTIREADRVTVHQEGPGFRGHQELLRLASP
jgi:hypothetical protein